MSWRLALEHVPPRQWHEGDHAGCRGCCFACWGLDRNPQEGAVQAMATPASSPIPLLMSSAAAASSPMSYFSYRGAGLEMADDEEDESTATPFVLAPQGAVPPGRAAPQAGTSLPSRVQQESFSTPSARDRQRLPMMSAPKQRAGAERSRRGPDDHDEPPPFHQRVEESEEKLFGGIQAIPHCEDNNSNCYRMNGQQVRTTGEEKKEQQHERFAEGASNQLSWLGWGDARTTGGPAAISDDRACSGNVVPGTVGSADRRGGGPQHLPSRDSTDHSPSTRKSASNPSIGRDDGSGGFFHGQRYPIAAVVDADDDDDDDDDNDRGGGKDSGGDRPDEEAGVGPRRGYPNEVDDDDDFIKSFLDQAVDAPCQRLTVAPCMADLMDRQMDLFMRCRQPLEFLSLFRDDIDPDDELQRTLHGSGEGAPYPLLHAVAPGAYVLPTFCEYCGATNAKDCDPHRCQRPHLYFAKKRPPFANASTAHTFFDPASDNAY